MTTLHTLGATLLSVAPFLLPVVLANRLLVRRRTRRRMARLPIRSSKRAAKREAMRYAKELTGKDLGWKATRKLFAKLEREGKAKGAIA